ncbi:MAG: MmcQ/YjbR family DNA-binding protein [Henriciella sp.]|nr:MmcQ/YjbR family DNA-binding protein [Henriciella sp.]
MVTIDAFKAIALSFPKAQEKAHFDRIGFRVDAPRGKIFATLLADGSSANLMLSRDEQDLLCAAEPAIFTPVPNKWGEKGATTMTLAAADETTVRSALKMAWTRAAPPKLKTAT